MLSDFHSEIYSWIRGALLILSIYHIIIYFQNNKKIYLYYSLYTFGLFIYFLKHILPLELAQNIYTYLNFVIQMLSYAAFVQLARLLLQTQNFNPKWDKYLGFAVKVLLVLSASFIFIQLTLGYQAQLNAFYIVTPLVTIFAILSFIVFYKIHGRHVKLFIIGSFIYIVLANLSFIKYILKSPGGIVETGDSSMFYIYIGSIIQILIYGFIIGYRIKELEDDNLINQLKLSNSSKETAELKMTALQSQMNPHFLFNSLNSINNFIIKSEVEKASDYITKFSKLIRVILNSSTSTIVSLNEELSIIELYVKLEQMRITGGFKFKTKIDKTLNLEEIKVPPLFLQPFIENAIWHGIMKKDGEKLIKLNIDKIDNTVRCVIEDNGIGINKAKESKTHISSRKKFFGAVATENRIKILYNYEDVHIDIIDISDDLKTGTRVTIVFPYASIN